MKTSLPTPLDDRPATHLTELHRRSAGEGFENATRNLHHAPHRLEVLFHMERLAPLSLKQPIQQNELVSCHKYRDDSYRCSLHLMRLGFLGGFNKEARLENVSFSVTLAEAWRCRVGPQLATLV